MFAIVDIAGQQFKVTQDQYLYVHRLPHEVGTTVELEQVLLTSSDKGTKVGAPIVAGAKVSAKVVEHLKDDKVLVFKKKRRKGYKKSIGHRQYLTKIQIEKLTF